MIEAAREAKGGDRRTESPAEVGGSDQKPRGLLDVVGAELVFIETFAECGVGERDAVGVDQLVVL